MSAEAWAALGLVVFVLLFLAGLFYLMHRYMRGQLLQDGGRRYDDLEGTDWFRSPERLERARERMAEAVQEERRDRNLPPAPKRPAEELYGDRVRGGDDA